MKKLLLLFMAVLLISAAMAQDQTPFKTEIFSEKKINRLEVSSSGGFVKVTGGAEIPRVNVYITGSNSKRQLSPEALAERLKAYVLEVNLVDGTLVCIAKVKDKKTIKNSERLSINFEIETPKNLDTDIKTSGGSLTLSTLNGNINFLTSGGSMALNNLSGKIKGVTSGGSIKLEHASGEIDLTTSGGSIRAENSNGNIKLITSGGSLTLSDLTGTIHGATSGGSITANRVDGNLNINTAAGSISVSDFKGNLNGKTSAGSIKGSILHIENSIELITSAGSIKVDLPFDEGMDLDLSGSRINSDKLPNTANNRKKETLKTQVNGGGKSVTLKTSSGSVSVN